MTIEMHLRLIFIYYFQRVSLCQWTWFGTLHPRQHPINNHEKEQYFYSSWWRRTSHPRLNQTQDWNKKHCQHGRNFPEDAKIVLLQKKLAITATAILNLGGLVKKWIKYETIYFLISADWKIFIGLRNKYRDDSMQTG